MNGSDGSKIRYWVFSEGKSKGPYTKQAIRSGFSGEDFVSHGNQWMKLDEHPDFCKPICHRSSKPSQIPKSLKCDNCGAPLKVSDKNDLARCQYCFAEVLIGGSNSSRVTDSSVIANGIREGLIAVEREKQDHIQRSKQAKIDEKLKKKAKEEELIEGSMRILSLIAAGALLLTIVWALLALLIQNLRPILWFLFEVFFLISLSVPPLAETLVFVYRFHPEKLRLPRMLENLRIMKDRRSRKVRLRLSAAIKVAFLAGLVIVSFILLYPVNFIFVSIIFGVGSWVILVTHMLMVKKWGLRKRPWYRSVVFHQVVFYGLILAWRFLISAFGYY